MVVKPWPAAYSRKIFRTTSAGFELLFQVVPLMSPQKTAVIFLARAALPASVDFATRHGAQAFLMKRLTSGDELAEAVRKAIAVVGHP